MNVRPSIAARALRVSRRTIYTWTATGHIPRDCVEFIGGRARYSLTRLAAHGFDLDQRVVAEFTGAQPAGSAA